MSPHIAYLDGNAAGGELSKVFALDVTAARGQWCCDCEHVLVRLVSARQGVFLDVRPTLQLNSERPDDQMLMTQHRNSH
jgi:hypothetical protein